MRKLEAEATTKLLPWLKENVGTGAYEIKHDRRTGKIRLDEFKEHQLAALAAAERGDKGIAYKISDESRGFKPFDVFVLRGVQAWLVLVYSNYAYCIPHFQYQFWVKEGLTAIDEHEATVHSRFRTSLTNL